MKKVLVSDKLAKEGVEIFEKAEGIEVDVKVGLKPEELKEIIGQYHGLAIRSATKVTAEIVAAADNLQVVGRAGIGVDNVDREAAGKRGIVVMNTPFGNTVTTAEHAISLMCSLARNTPQANASMKEGKWEKSKFSGVELYQKTLGLVGAGNIGSIVADRAQGLKMNVIVFDPYLSEERARELGVEQVEFDDLLARADFVSVHTPLTDTTRGLINADAMSKMKDGVRIINCARGGIVDEQALVDAVSSGKVAGAAFDVFTKEPIESDHPFLSEPRIICTPHLGASTGEAQVNVAVDVANQICDFLLKGVIRNALNLPSASPEEQARLEPYLVLGEKLGSFAAQAHAGSINCIEIEYSGEIAEMKTDSVKLAVVKGVLSPIVGEDAINLVNAVSQAKERGIDINENSQARPRDWSTMVSVKLKGGDADLQIAGTLVGRGNDPLIVQINGLYVDSRPRGNILMVRNKDVPGVVGAIGTLLGEKGVNISGLDLVRKNEGEEALSLIHLDDAASPEVLDALTGLDTILSVRQVNL